MMEIDVRHEPKGGLERLKEQFPNIGARVAGTVASQFAQFIRAHYLSGQVLGKRTGQTKRTTKSKWKEKGVYRVRPGVGVRGNLNYLYRFERGGRPFMQPGLVAFRGQGRVESSMRLVYNRAQAAVVRRGANILEVDF